MMARKYPRNKLMIVAGLCYFVLFALFIVSKNYLPDAGGGWSDPPIFDYLFLLGTGICLSIISIGITYYSWTLSEKEYIEWYTDQQIIDSKWAKTWINIWINLNPEGGIIWINRIMGPIGILISIFLICSMLFSIFKYLFR